jgi:hypothetical protein
MPHQASTQLTRTQGSLRGGVPLPQRGVWGSAPPDPGSASTRNICRSPVSIVYSYAQYQSVGRYIHLLHQEIPEN